MNVLMSIWTFFANNFLKTPAYFIGLITIVGYILLKKKWYDVFSGFIKATVGYKILLVGSGGLSSTFKPIISALSSKFGIDALVLDTYVGQVAAQSAIETVGKSFSQVMVLLLIAFIFNILLVKFQKVTKLRAVFTTGHVQTQQATFAFWIFLTCFPKLGDTPMLILMAVLLGLYWAVGSNLTVETAQRLTDGAGFCVAHQQMFGIAIYEWVGSKLFKKGSAKKFEDYELPGWLSIFNENMVSTSVLMLLFIGVIMIVTGKEALVATGVNIPNGSFFFCILDNALAFAVYMAVLQLGVRVFVGELTNSFQGISNKLLPGAVPGLDCAASYGFGSANAVTFGFIFGSAGQFLAIGILIAMKSPLIAIAGFVPVFFDNATISVYVNAKSGAKAAMFASFVNGLLQVFCSVLAAQFFALDGVTVVSQTISAKGWMAMFDWAVIWPAFGVIMHYLGYIGVAIIVIILVAIPQLQYKADPDGYFLCVEDWEAYKKHVAEKEGKKE